MEGVFFLQHYSESNGKYKSFQQICEILIHLGFIKAWIGGVEKDNFDLWRQEITTLGYASSVALPLLEATEVVGVLNLYSDQKNSFGEKELEFLSEVGADIALGIKSIIVEQEMTNRFF